jgi:CubicO group peptidase (beta-lactamase class C family)
METQFQDTGSLKNFETVPTLAVGYNDDPDVQQLMAQALCGARPFSAKLAVSPTTRFPKGSGIETKVTGGLTYGLPESVGMSSSTLDKIDDIIEEMIGQKVTPGCQVLVARNGTVVFNKAYGFHTYERERPVQIDDVYDLASMTKIASTTLACMRLYEEGKLDIEARLSDYIPELRSGNKKNIRIRDILTHTAGLEAWIPFYKKTLTNRGGIQEELYRSVPDKEHQIRVAEGMFLKNNYVDEVWKDIIQSPVNPRQGYKYSDLGFYLLAKAVQNLTGETIDRFVTREFYKPMGMGLTFFHPRNHVPLDRIIPTEEDNYWRHQRVQGDVQDMGAAMLGGAAGNAGLFSNAMDMARIYQMLMEGGSYAGVRYFNENTVRLFTQRPNGQKRRGLGFDCYDLTNSPTRNVCAMAGTVTFGHMGYTGTCGWADPQNGLVYIFLSNRTYPKSTNNALNAGQWRQKIQQVAYEAIVR